MLFEHVIDEGTVEVRESMSEYMQSLPTATQWQLFIALTRPAHAKVFYGQVFYTCVGCGSKFIGAPNAIRTKIAGRDNKEESIVVGCKVRIEEEVKRETRITNGKAVNYIEYKPMVRPALHRGLGCVVCLERFSQEVSSVMGYNAQSERINTARAKLADIKTQLEGCVNCKQPQRTHDTNGNTCKKFKPHTFRGEALRSPFIMLFEHRECEACKDTFHVWNKNAINPVTKEKGWYVICSCYKPHFL